MPSFKLNDIFAGRYLLVELLQEEHTRELWKAIDQLAEDSAVMLKICTSDHALEADTICQFRQEFFFAQRFSHPHLLKVNHFEIAEGVPYLVLPYCPAGNLDRLLEEEGTFSEHKIALLLCQIGAALDELHRQEPPVLHRNVRPENILTFRSDYFLLSTLGLGNGSGHLNFEADAVAYTPPESYGGMQEPDVSADIFAFGVTLYQMCTKTVPWNGAGGQALLTGDEAPALPEYYPAELSELLQACMAPDSSRRPTAADLHLRGKHFLETGNWNLAESGNERFGKLKRIVPYFLAAVVLGLFVLGAFWEFRNNHLGISTGFQQVAGTSERGQDVDEMLIEVLEEERRSLAKRARELEERNRELMHRDSINKMLLRNQENLLGQYGEQYVGSEDAVKTDKPSSNTAAPASVAIAPKKESIPSSPKDLEEQLNKIANPSLSGKARSAWKAETMAQFAEGAVRIFDETEGTPKQYSASIFLNLLYKVPHTIVVKEVKRDQNKKVTELRLTMKAKM